MANTNDAVSTLNTNLGKKAPTSHASTGTGYGVGTTSNYGHVKTINALTKSSYANGEALSAYQGYVLKQLIDTLNGIGTIGSAFHFYGTSSENYTYGCYNQGIYTITGAETGIPEADYPGYMLTLRHSNAHIVKIAFLVNSHVHVMGQGTDGTVASNWRRLAIAGVDC